MFTFDACLTYFHSSPDCKLPHRKIFHSADDVLSCCRYRMPRLDLPREFKPCLDYLSEHSISDCKRGFISRKISSNFQLAHA